MSLSVVRSLVLVLIAVAGTQTRSPGPSGQLPDFKVEIRASLADFSARMDAYAELRSRLEQGLPALAVTDHPAEILRAETMLATRIRQARQGARRGDIFAKGIRAAFRQLLRDETNAGTCELIGDDNPGEFSSPVNGTYPKREPVSTVPASMLAVLPRLPADVQYRFLRHDLVLHDLRANVILDRMEEAIECPPRD